MAYLDRKTMERWNRDRILNEIERRDRMVEMLIKEEMEQSEAYAPLEIDLKHVVDREEHEIRELRDEIRTLTGLLH